MVTAGEIEIVTSENVEGIEVIEESTKTNTTEEKGDAKTVETEYEERKVNMQELWLASSYSS